VHNISDLRGGGKIFCATFGLWLGDAPLVSRGRIDRHNPGGSNLLHLSGHPFKAYRLKNQT
jgi:hypothetical protein